MPANRRIPGPMSVFLAGFLAVVMLLAVFGGVTIYHSSYNSGNSFGYHQGYANATKLKLNLGRIDESWGRYDPYLHGYVRNLEVAVANAKGLLDVRPSSWNTLALYTQDLSETGFSLQVVAKPQQTVVIDIAVTADNGNGHLSWYDTTPDLPANAAPPKVNLTVERVDFPAILPKLVYRVTATLGSGEDPATMSNEVRYTGTFKWGVPFVLVMNCANWDPFGNNIEVFAFDRENPTRPEGIAVKPTDCPAAG